MRVAFRPDCRAIIIIATLFLAGVCSAAADNRTICDHSDSPPDSAIKACTIMITNEGQDFSAGLLALTYSNRGVAFQRKGDFDRAMSDFEQAIRLDQKFAAAYSNRGRLLSQKNDLDGAIADLSKAIALDATN